MSPASAHPVQDHVSVSLASASLTVIVSVAVSVVPEAASVTEPVSSESAITGASFVFSRVTVAAIESDTVSSPAPVVPPLSFIEVIVTTLLLDTVGASSVFL